MVFTGNILMDLIGLLVAVAAVIFVYFKWTFQYWKRKNIPYLEGTIPYGSIMAPYKKTLGDQFADMYDYAKAKGMKYVGLYLFAKPHILVADLDLLKNIMTKDFNSFDERGFFHNPKKEAIAGHLFAIGGAQWRHIRVKLTPTFTTGKMRIMYKIIEDYGILLEKQIEKLAAKRDAVDIKDVLARFTVDVIGSCAFGLDCNSFTDPENRFLKMGKSVIELDSWTLMKQNFEHNFPKVGKFFNMRFFAKGIDEFYNDIVRKAVAYREQNNIERKDFLQMLIEIKNKKNIDDGSEKPLTMEELIAQCFVFFIAGFETSSSTMAFASYELAVNPEVQDRVRGEIHEVLAKYDNKLTYDALKELEYMDQVIDETLRKYAPVVFLTRECTKNYKIPNSTDVIEKGTVIAIPLKGIHYDKDIYENPEKFIPERFSPENKKHRHQYAHIPFGEGPRICIGKRFGITQTKVGLVTLLKNHKITLNSKTRVPFEYDTQSPLIAVVKGGIWLNIEEI